MKKRVLIAGLFHETHTFLEGTTGLRDFHILRGDEMLSCKGDSSPLGGVLAEAERYGWEIIPTIDYRAQPSATVEDEVFEQFWTEFTNFAAASWSAVAMPPLSSARESSEVLDAVESGSSATALSRSCGTAAPIDAVYLVLHGAMVTESIRDVEGELLQRLRAMPELAQVPIFGVFDLHANFTPRMAELSQGLVGYRENPHTDAREAACHAAAQLQRRLSTSSITTQKLAITNIVWPPTGTATANAPMKTLEAMARASESESGIWSITVVAGFSFADTEHTGVSFVGFGDDALALSRSLQELADKAHELRHLGNVTDPPLSEIIPQVKASQEGLTVLVEPSDNIGGGAPGDGTGLLRALLEHDISNSAVCIADPAAVKAAEAAGVGLRVILSIGGKGSRLDAGPVEIEVEVVSLKDGRFELEDKNSHLASMCGDTFNMGRCAVVRHRGISLLLTSIKTPPFDLGQWRSQGIEPTQLSVICVKAAVAHRRAYDPIATRMLWVDTPGPCSSNLKTLPYKHIRRPIYPLDS